MDKDLKIKQGWITEKFGDKRHYKDNKLHSINNLPAVILFNGDKHWYKNGLIHRDNDLPAVIYSNGYKAWFQNHKRHRINGPAIIRSNGDKEYWIDNTYLSKEEFNKQSQKVIENKKDIIYNG